MNEHYQKWNNYAPRGLFMIAFGLFSLMRAIRAQNKNRGILNWGLQFLMAVVSINFGVATFGEAIKERVLYEIDVRELLKKEDA